METKETYQKYQRFLSEVERKFTSSLIGKSDQEKKIMLELTQKILDSFVDLYGDDNTDNQLLIDAKIVLSQVQEFLN